MPVQKINKKGNVLTIDIGGTNIKTCILSENGQIIEDYISKPTPQNASPADVVDTIVILTKELKNYEKIAVGFPGYVRNGVVQTAPNLAANKWVNIPLADQISEVFDKPVRLINDADLQGLGCKRKRIRDRFYIRYGFWHCPTLRRKTTSAF